MNTFKLSYVEVITVIKWVCIRTANEHQLELMHMYHSTCARFGKTSAPSRSLEL